MVLCARAFAEQEAGPRRFEMAKQKPVDKFFRDEDRNLTSILSRLKSKKQLRKFAKKHAKTWREDFYGSAMEN